MSLKLFLGAAALVASLSISATRATITIPTVAIGYPGNAADPTTGFGSVAYSFNMGTTEVTNAQYAAFLSAVAATDTYNLYTTNMAGAFGGITRSGSPGSYTYATIAGRANNPVNFVSFWDAARFANWLHNGQPTGPQNTTTTEDGAYTLTLDGITTNTTTRNAGWRWAVTTENEWYKAAYHHPTSQGGDADNYWLFPTSSNTINTTHANYGSAIGSTTPAGSYAVNFYGSLDMGGNVWEWNDTIQDFTPFRGLRGAGFDDVVNWLRADHRWGDGPTLENAYTGFRLAHIPAPACIGDVNGDGVTNAADFNILASNFRATVTPNTSGDLNGDGIVNALDFNILAGDFRCGV